MFYDTKVIIKGKGKNYDESADGLEFKVKTEGDECFIFDMITATLISLAIEYDITKKELVDHIRRNYEVISKERNDKDED